MVKYIIILLIILSSCTQYIAVTPDRPDYNLILENSIVDIDLYENNRQVYIENTGSQLIIAVDYNINEDNIIVYDIVVPNEKMFLYDWLERPSYDVTIQINNVELY